MLLFCPSCSNVLTVSTTASPEDQSPVNRMECQTCPYQYIITKRFFERKHFKRIEREDVFGGAGSWDNTDKTKINCKESDCAGQEAAWFQVQIRSADEPMTSFYKCMTCGHRWREN